MLRLPSFDEILASIPRESDEEKANRQERDQEWAALREARERANLDHVRDLYAREHPTFEAHLRNARNRHGLT